MGLYALVVLEDVGLSVAIQIFYTIHSFSTTYLVVGPLTTLHKQSGPGVLLPNHVLQLLLWVPRFLQARILSKGGV